MTQSIILAAGQTAATASDVTIAPGSSATFSIRSATAGRSIPINISIPIALVVGADLQTKASLNFIEPTVSVAAAGVWRVKRPDISAYGVDIEVRVDQ